MITRSAIKKSFAKECEVTKPLLSATKSKTKYAVKTKMGIQTPIKAYNGNHNSEASFENVQSPVFNIHVHMPTTTMTSDINKSGQLQPIIHLHFGELVQKFTPGMASENFEMINKTAKVELPSEVNYNSEEQSNSNESTFLKPHKKKRICKKLNFYRSKGSGKNIKTEKSEAVLKSVEEIKEKEELRRKSFHEMEYPVRRSIRQANNRKLLKALKDLSADKSITTKIKTKRCKNVNTDSKSGSSGKTLKEPVVILHDVRKEMENIAFQNDTINGGEEACFICVNTNACDVGGQEKVKKCSYDSLSERDYEQNSEGKEGNEKCPIFDSFDQSKVSVSKKFGKIYPLIYSSDNETNSVTDNGIVSEEVGGILQSMTEPEKSVYDSSLEVIDNCGKVTKNNQINNVLLQSEEDRNLAVMKNDVSVLLPKDRDLSMKLKFNDINDDKIVSVDSESNNFTESSCNKPNLVDSDFGLSQTETFDKDNLHTASLSALEMERFKNFLNSENNNLVKNVIEGNKLLSTESDDYKEINVNTLNFQLELIKKEMKNRDLTINKKSSKKKSLTKKKASQICNETSEKSSVATKIRLSNKMTKNMSTEINGKKSSSAKDYIPLQISGPTEFAVAQLSKIKPYSAHKAKNFKNEMLFGKRVNRYSNPKYLETYLLKRKAAAKRNK